MHAIITAGGTITEKDRLYPILPGGVKALLNIHGKPMIQYVLDALNAAPSVENIIIVGLPQNAPVTSAKPLTFLPDHGSLMSNGEAGAAEVNRIDPQAKLALYLCSDVPLLCGEMIEWMVAAVSPAEHDFYYTVVERSVMERRFPTSRRTYQKLKDIEVCGGDVFAIRPAAVAAENPLWRRIIEARKNPIRQVSMMGWGLVVGILFRRYTLQQCEDIASQRLGFRGKILPTPYAEMGMDVDKPHQLEIVQRELAPTAA